MLKNSSHLCDRRQILVKRGTKNIYETPYQGPYTLTNVNENGTARLMIKDVQDNINIRRLKPDIGTDDIPHGGECSMRTTRVRRRIQE